MRGRLFLSLAVAALAAMIRVGAGELPVRAEVEQIISSSGADVAVAFRSLDGRDELLIQPDVEFTPPQGPLVQSSLQVSWFELVPGQPVCSETTVSYAEPQLFTRSVPLAGAV